MYADTNFNHKRIDLKQSNEPINYLTTLSSDNCSNGQLKRRRRSVLRFERPCVPHRFAVFHGRRFDGRVATLEPVGSNC